MKFLITPWFINHQLALAMGVCHVPLQGLKWKLLSPVWLFVTPGTIQSMEFSRPEYWSWKPFPSPRIFPTQGLNPGLPHCRKILYQLSYQGSPIIMIKSCWSYWPLIPHWGCRAEMMRHFLLQENWQDMSTDSSVDSVNMSLSMLWEMVKDRKAWRADFHGVTKSQTEVNDWTTITTTMDSSMKIFEKTKN